MLTDEYPKRVTDIKGTPYQLVKLIGEGGQGAVFSTTDQRTAVKLIRANSLEATQLSSRIERIAHLPLWDYSLARPVIPLEPGEHFVGYVMDFLAGMVPILQLMLPPISDDPQAFPAWYVTETGGLRRRLVLLAKAAETLSALHSLGLVLGDPSPANILVSDDPSVDAAWIIDPDNIGVPLRDKEDGIPFGTPVASSFFTATYAAPELMRGSPVSSLTDVYAFAQIACHTLLTVHPFIGDLVSAGEPDLELPRAFAGEYPWICDEDDASNRTSRGYPAEIVLTSLLRQLSQRTFGGGRSEGRNFPLNRPGIATWAQALFGAADLTMPCKNCGATFYAINEDPDLMNACPWCDTKRGPFALLQIRRWIPALGERALQEPVYDMRPGLKPGFVVVPETPIVITRRIAYGEDGVTHPGSADTPLLELHYDGRAILSKPLQNSCDFWAAFDLAGTEVMDLSQSVELTIEKGGWLHFGSREKNHRVAQVVRPQGVRSSK